MFQRGNLLKEQEELDRKMRELSSSLIDLSKYVENDIIEFQPIDLVEYSSEDEINVSDFSFQKEISGTNLFKVISELFGPDLLVSSGLFSRDSYTYISVSQVGSRIRRAHRTLIRIAKRINKSLQGSIRVIDFRNLTKVFRLNVIHMKDDEDLNTVQFSNFYSINIINHRKYETRIFRPII